MAKADRTRVSVPEEEAGTMVDAGGIEFDLFELFFRLLDKWFLIVLCAVIGGGAAYFYTARYITPLYQATAKIYVLTSRSSAVNLSDLQIGSILTYDYQEVFNTWEVHERVRANLDLPYNYGIMQSMLSVSNPEDTRILNISVSSDDPIEAAMMANEYATVAKRYISEIMSTEQPNLLSEALVPNVPYTPNRTRNAAMGFVAGAAIPMGIILLLFMLDDKIRSADDISKYAGIPTLAVVPIVKEANSRRGAIGG